MNDTRESIQENYSLEKNPKIEIKMSMPEKSGCGRSSSSEQPNQNINVNQQPVTVQVVTLRDALMVLPEFNGRNIPLA